MMLLMVKSLAVAGEFGTHLRALTGVGQSGRTAATWRQMLANLEESPPSRLVEDRPNCRLHVWRTMCGDVSLRVTGSWFSGTRRRSTTNRPD